MEMEFVFQASLIVISIVVTAAMAKIDRGEIYALEQAAMHKKILECSNHLSKAENRSVISEITITENKNVSFLFRGTAYTISAQKYGLLVLSRETTGITGIFTNPEGVKGWINDNTGPQCQAA
ncbi:hypothetical protein [Vibrio owensii]|uniref:hypothetical protein n=1 Tax=Vibrio owensii TaxID=696485 RepID=UPI0018F156FF|nr:hypothetical protein [Vibrio owensii]